MSCDALLKSDCNSDGPFSMGLCKDLGRFSLLNRQQVHMRKAASLCRRHITDRIWYVRRHNV